MAANGISREGLKPGGEAVRRLAGDLVNLKRRIETKLLGEEVRHGYVLNLKRRIETGRLSRGLQLL